MTEKKEAQLLKRIERMDSNIFALREVIKEGGLSNPQPTIVT